MIHKSGVVDGKRIYESVFKRLPENATDLEFQISSYQVWRLGIYDSERAAKYAFRFKDSVLERLQEKAGPDGKITFKMLRETRKNA